MQSSSSKGLKPWYAARWETVEPEEDTIPEEDYNTSEPTINELLDYEDKVNGTYW